MLAATAAGRVDPRGGEREDAGGHQGAPGGHLAQHEQGTVGGGAHHGVRQPPLLRAHPRGLHDRSDDAHLPAHAPRLSARVRAQEQEQHRLQGPAQLEHADREGARSFFRFIYTFPFYI